MKSSIKISFIFIFLILLGKSGYNQCIEHEHCFIPGEKITYEVAYNWGFLWVDAGEVYFKVDSAKLDEKELYHFKSFGKSHRFYDWVYKVRDNFESLVEPESFDPQYFSRRTSEGGYDVNNEYSWDHENNYIITSTENTDNAHKSDTLLFSECTLDVLSAIYFARNINFNELVQNDSIPINFIIDGDLFKLYIKYLQKEQIENRDGKLYNCIKFSAQVAAGTIFKENEDITVWVSNDKNRIPILIEAKILIGSIKAYIIGYEGLKYEMEALLK
jgi:hypothetical protein